ncbi:hypothetical protein M5K25_006479 [Dendrobium thyrsiflorum]|uniref:Uncharacterized protein n=1 Tax=Dendrobium thyrsiflorum TaxID=117978 RepID=A0ABD0VCS1_DENTH
MVHSKADCRILHPHLNDTTIYLHHPVIAGDMATNNFCSNGCSTIVPSKIVGNLDNIVVNPMLTNVGDVASPSNANVNLVTESITNAMDDKLTTVLASNSLSNHLAISPNVNSDEHRSSISEDLQALSMAASLGLCLLLLLFYLL